jgi:hypothetical protein
MRIVFLTLTRAAIGVAQSNDLVAIDTPSATNVVPTPPPAFTAHDRFRWVVLTTVGPKNLAAGVAVTYRISSKQEHSAPL